jgi:sulfur carrier protein
VTYSEIKLKINGNLEKLGAGTTVAQLIAQRKLNPGQIVVELNLNIIPGEGFAATILNEGDTVEILHFVGGG